MNQQTTAKPSIGSLVETLLPLLLLGLLIAMCIQLLIPFVALILWTIVLTICFVPAHNALKRRGMRSRWSATLIGTLLAALVLVPTAVAATSAATTLPQLVADLRRGERHIRPPPASLEQIPLVGKKAHATWAQASADTPAFAKQYSPQLASFTKWLLSQAAGMFVAILLVLGAIICAAITLAYVEGARAFTLSTLARVTGSRERGEHYMNVIGATVRSVANGVLGVAFVQALLCGIGFFAIGVPGAGVLSLIVMVLGTFQVPVVIVVLPIIIWAFSAKTMTVAIIFMVWEIVSSLSDAVLKPLLIGHGLEVPMPIILLGVIGGVIVYGLVGLFIGAVVLAVGYVLFREWLDAPAAKPKKSPTLQAAE